MWEQRSHSWTFAVYPLTLKMFTGTQSRGLDHALALSSAPPMGINGISLWWKVNKHYISPANIDSCVFVLSQEDTVPSVPTDLLSWFGQLLPLLSGYLSTSQSEQHTAEASRKQASESIFGMCRKNVWLSRPLLNYKPPWSIQSSIHWSHNCLPTAPAAPAHRVSPLHRSASLRVPFFCLITRYSSMSILLCRLHENTSTFHREAPIFPLFAGRSFFSPLTSYHKGRPSLPYSSYIYYSEECPYTHCLKNLVI